jgi:hypothetical protein
VIKVIGSGTRESDALTCEWNHACGRRDRRPHGPYQRNLQLRLHARHAGLLLPLPPRGNVSIYLQSMQAYFMMPFAGIFFFGVLSRRVTTAGVLACIASAGVVCPALMVNNLLIAEG